MAHRKALASSILSAFSSARHACPHHHCDGGITRISKRVRSGISDGGNTDYAFEMVCSTIRFGPGVTREIGADLRNMNAKRVMVITDERVAKLHPVETALDSLRKNGVEYQLYDRVRVEPTDVSWKDAIDAARSYPFDAFIAVGGGSSMDTAKAAALYAAHPKADFLDFVQKPLGKQVTPTNALKPLIAVPTTAGTGSETTTVAIFDFEKEHIKTGIRNRVIKPTLAIVDPDNVKTLPRNVAICSGFDVLCHALESYTARPFHQRRPRPENPSERPVYQGSNPISDVWSREALRIIRDYFRRAVNDPTDDEACSKMLLASSFAGVGFGNAGVHLCHALSYPISANVKNYVNPDYPPRMPLVPHGLAVVTTACADFQFTAPACPDRHLEAAELLGADVAKYKNKGGGDAAGPILADVIRGFMSDFKVANGLKAMGFERRDTNAFVDNVVRSMQGLLHLAPREQTSEALQKIYDDSMIVY